ncbi:uncharacterized protein LOC115765995 [Drosophila novamexicana]|uniref:uncharacterized protein LOC115765995 n=1 Tax=Drosophila novamexicana TaxID=47314 RepID=UPI0011E60384|nr:uncharacterized protein LOC115765995 [Drosophila novamexicana]
MEVNDLSSDSEEFAKNLAGQPIPFPLPPHKDPTICRDQFLKTLLKPFESIEHREDESLRKSSIQYHHTSVTAEGMAIMRMLQGHRATIKSVDVTEFRPLLTWEDLQVLYKACLYQFQKSAIEFLSVRLRKQIDTILNIWPGEVDEIPHKLFHWSFEHFLPRIKINQLYLDVLAMERTKHDLDCAKFCIDIKEIIRLLQAIRMDFFSEKDFCASSLELLNQSNYEVNSAWVAELEQLRATRKNLTTIAHGSSFRLESQFGSRMVAENDKADAIMLIEMRYRVNWLRSCGDQHQMWLQSKENVYLDEMNELLSEIKHNKETFGFVDFVYQYQVDSYRAAIVTWQERLDTDLEAAELECNITRNLWIKAKDDLKFYKEQVEMFKARVLEVLALGSEEEGAQGRSKTRRSTKSLGSRKSKLSTGRGVSPGKNKKKKKK